MADGVVRLPSATHGVGDIEFTATAVAAARNAAASATGSTGGLPSTATAPPRCSASPR
jgi:hypothetical protein